MAEMRDSSTLSWIALVVALVALALGWIAYNRSGAEVVPTVERGAEEVTEESALVAARVEARTRLLALQTKVAAEEGYESAASEAAEVRTDLMMAYEDAERVASDEWRDLEMSFQELEAGLRDGSADVVDTLAGLLALLGQDLRTDDK